MSEKNVDNPQCRCHPGPIPGVLSVTGQSIIKLTDNPKWSGF
ncbi:MAG TPA: hypothetical protein VF677_16750 [Flavobacterium sp.]